MLLPRIKMNATSNKHEIQEELRIRMHHTNYITYVVKRDGHGWEHMQCTVCCVLNEMVVVYAVGCGLCLLRLFSWAFLKLHRTQNRLSRTEYTRYGRADFAECLHRREIRESQWFLHGFIIFLDFEQRVGVLQRLDFVNRDRTVLLKGRVACEVRRLRCDCTGVDAIIKRTLFEAGQFVAKTFEPK